MAKILGIFECFIEAGSGWTLSKILNLKLDIAKVRPFQGGCIGKPLPKNVANKRCCLTIHCTDNRCFLYSILAALYPVTHNCRNESKYYQKHENKLDTSCLEYPVKVTHIKKFEKLNPVSVNVFGMQNGVASPLYITTERTKQNHVNLLLHDGHYYLVKNLSALLAKQYSSYKSKLHYCNYCLVHFRKKEKLDEHSKNCSSSGQMVEMPPEKTYMKFRNYYKLVPLQFCIIADLESAQCRDDN